MPTRPVTLLTALVLGDLEQYAEAWAMLRAEALNTDRAALDSFVGEETMADWLFDRLRSIRLLGSFSLRKSPAKPPAKASPKPAAKLSPQSAAKKPVAKLQPVRPVSVSPALPVIADLPKLEARFDMAFELANTDAIEVSGVEPAPVAFRLRSELVRLSLLGASTNCSACRRSRAWRRIGIRSRPSARC